MHRGKLLLFALGLSNSLHLPPQVQGKGCKATYLGGRAGISGGYCMNSIDDDTLTWAIVGTVLGLVAVIGITILACTYWQRHSNNFRAFLLGVPFLQKYLRTKRDSLDDLEDEGPAITSQKIRQWRRDKVVGVVGVKTNDRMITKSGTSGYRWKKKWRDRKARSKERRKIKHQERKKRRAQRAAKRKEQSGDSSDDDDDDDDNE